LAADHAIVAAVWAPSGVALAATILLGYRIWPAVALGALVANATAESSLAMAAGIASGKTLGALTGAWLLRQARFDPALKRVRDVISLAILGAALSAALDASIGMGAVWATGESGGLWSSWEVWWLGDLTGVLVVTPAVLIVALGPRLSARSDQVAERTVLAAVLVGVTMLALGQEVTLAYPVFPLIVLAAMRFRQGGAVVAALAVATLTVVYTATGEGPFVGDSADADLLAAQLFVALGAMTALVVAAMKTERETAEAALSRHAESERELAEAQALAHIGSWRWDVEADRVSWSDELHRIFGVDCGSFDATCESFLKYIHPEDRELVETTVGATLAGGKPFEFEHRVMRPNGEERMLHSRGRVICDADGRPREMVGTAQDVTDRSLAQERFRALLEAAPDAIVIVNERGRIELINSQTLELFGYRRDELIGEPVEVLMPDRAARVHPAHVEAFVADPRARGMGTGLDLTAVRKDGTEFPVEVSLSPLRTPNGMLISSAIRDVTERKLAEQKLAHQALHDPLTGLPNRVLLLDRLEHALARSRRPESGVAVLFCDIDDFKVVNDSLGHEVGDGVLTALPACLRQALREGDTVARFGGDEFVILCEDLGSAAEAMTIAERISAVVARPFDLEHRRHHLSVSVGVVFVEGGRATASDVLCDADAAMYRAKGSGKGQFELFDARMRADLVGRLQTENELRRALREGELRLLYQPVLALTRYEFVGAEALVRWQHPERGLLPPSEFIGVAEDSGLIGPLGEWVIAEACGQAAAWGKRNGHGPGRISINLSPRQVSDADIAEALGQTLQSSGVDPALVELEITENALLEEGDAPRRTLQRLKDMGVRLVLDDFGTGYSSLSRLKRFPIDALKIDREFIDGLGTDAEDTAIVSAVLSMAQALGVDVVAEGVETSAQLAWLEEHGCTSAQGYLLAPPLTAVQLEEYRTDPTWFPAVAPADVG
jgi:diguanylate cyclase (GGDEF)-like protein/PAS domain S-box-containing protein